MTHFAAIGIGAGAAAALLFASVTSGTLLSIPLFYLAPLPIMIAGLGWSHWVALIAIFTGAIALGMAFGAVFLFAFIAGAGIPGWWLCYLTMLARSQWGRQRAREPSNAGMVSTRSTGNVGGASSCICRACRYSEFWHRRRQLSCGTAWCASYDPAR